MEFQSAQLHTHSLVNGQATVLQPLLWTAVVVVDREAVGRKDQQRVGYARQQQRPLAPAQPRLDLAQRFR